MKPQHKHYIIRAELLSFFSQGQEAQLRQWMHTLIEDMGMNIMLGPFVHYCTKPGLEGWSGACLIETSHIALHVWDVGYPVVLQLDVYTCGEMKRDVILAALEEFSVQKFSAMMLDREKKIEQIA